MQPLKASVCVVLEGSRGREKMMNSRLHRGWTANTYIGITTSLLFAAPVELGRCFSRCWPSNQQAFPNICAINRTEEYSPQVQLAAELKVVFVRLNLPSESTPSHSLEKPLPPLTTQGTYRDTTEHTPFSSNSDCQTLGGE